MGIEVSIVSIAATSSAFNSTYVANNHEGLVIARYNEVSGRDWTFACDGSQQWGFHTLRKACSFMGKHNQWAYTYRG